MDFAWSGAKSNSSTDAANSAASWHTAACPALGRFRGAKACGDNTHGSSEAMASNTLF